MADVRPSREKAHLVVAAIRVIEHQRGRSPMPEEVSQLLEWGNEETHVVLRGLVDAGILRMHATPFEAHYEITDYQKISDLPAEADKEMLQDEVEKFQRESKSRHEKMERLLKSGGMSKKERRIEALEKQFADFKKKPPSR